MAEYTSLAIGGVAGGIFFASTLLYMRRKAKVITEEKKAENPQRTIIFPESVDRTPELVAHR